MLRLLTRDAIRLTGSFIFPSYDGCVQQILRIGC